jgi:ribonucleoside-diphosphate reductase alpha chain
VIEKGSIQEIDEFPESAKKIFVTALDISPEDHILMQASFQKYVDNAVSKTVNLRNSATEEDVKKIFLLAYKLKLKGVTVYRDKSRITQVLKVEEGRNMKEKLKPRPRPQLTRGITLKMKTGCGNLYVTINEDELGICEVFSTLGKAGGCAASQTEAISRLISLSLRSGIDINSIIKQLKGIRCPSPIRNEEGEYILSCSDAIAKALEKYIIIKEGKNNSKISTLNLENKDELYKEYSGIPCPECGAPLDAQESCFTCRICGYSKCY